MMPYLLVHLILLIFLTATSARAAAQEPALYLFAASSEMKPRGTYTIHADDLPDYARVLWRLEADTLRVVDTLNIAPWYELAQVYHYPEEQWLLYTERKMIEDVSPRVVSILNYGGSDIILKSCWQDSLPNDLEIGEHYNDPYRTNQVLHGYINSPWDATKRKTMPQDTVVYLLDRSLNLRPLQPLDLRFKYARGACSPFHPLTGELLSYYPVTGERLQISGSFVSHEKMNTDAPVQLPPSLRAGLNSDIVLSTTTPTYTTYRYIVKTPQGPDSCARVYFVHNHTTGRSDTFHLDCGQRYYLRQDGDWLYGTVTRTDSSVQNVDYGLHYDYFAESRERWPGSRYDVTAGPPAKLADTTTALLFYHLPTGRRFSLPSRDPDTEMLLYHNATFYYRAFDQIRAVSIQPKADASSPPTIDSWLLTLQ